MKRSIISVALVLFMAVGSQAEVRRGLPYINPLTPTFTTITTTGGGTIGTWLRIGSTLDVAGTSTFVSSVTVKSSLQVTGDLALSGNILNPTTFKSTNTFQGLSSFENNVIVDKDINTNTLTCGGTSQHYGDAGFGNIVNPITATSSFTVKGVLGTTDNLDVAKDGKVANNLAVTKTITGNDITVSTFGSTGNGNVGNNLSVTKTITANAVEIASGTATTSFSIGGMNFKGYSFDAALKLLTPSLYDVYWSTDTFTMWIATGATACGFRVISSGVTPP